MNKIKVAAFIALGAATSTSFAATLNSMNKAQVMKALVNKTAVTINSIRLRGRLIHNTATLHFDAKGNVWAKLSTKLKNLPSQDRGVYSIENDGTFHLTWQHWEGGKKLCSHFFNTRNSYLVISCDQEFQTAFMKNSISSSR